jgi:hypothetical protein
MEVRITYRSEVYIKGDSLEEIKDKWEALNLTSQEGNSNFVELCSVEDAETYEDLENEFNNL